MARRIVKSKYFFEEDFLETIAEVPAEEPKPWPSNDKLKVIGKSISRLDGYDKVSGTAVYSTDVYLQKMVYAKTLRSPVAHARIKSIDTTQAENFPGVLKILTHKNAPKIPWYYETSMLFDPHVRYQGDEVACIVAESTQIAEQASKLIKVEYEELPHVADVETAMRDDSPQLFDWGNIVRGKPSTYNRGDLEKGFNESDVVVNETYTTQVVVHNPTEPHSSVVNWDGNKLTVWDSTQAVFNVRDNIAEALGLPASKVRVIKKYMGGGFGSKLEAGKYTVMAALISRELGRPLKITLDRREMNLAVGNRPNSIQILKLGAKNDGTLEAMSHRSFGAVGAYPGGAGCSWPLRTVYKCPNVSTEEYSVLINAGRARPFRAPGHVQGTFALDSIIDEVAEKLNMDPLEFRLQNYAEIDQVSNQPYTSKRLREAYEKGAAAIGWHKERKTPGSDPGPLKRGIGMASQIWWGGGGPPAYATLKFNRDGSLHIVSGTQDIGTGTYTILAQVAAEVLEIPIENIMVSIGDTDTCPYAPSSGGSTTAASISPAVRDAAEQMKDMLISGASAILEIPKDELVYSGGMISNKHDNSKQTKITDIINKMDDRILVSTGARGMNPEGNSANSFGAQFAKVEVDTETGKIKVIKIVAAHDIGRVLNQKTMENQFHGGIMQGLGFALMEQRIIDQGTGKALTTHMYANKLPTIMDTPEIEIIIVSDTDNRLNNTGVKGIGEPAIIPTAGAIANAVYNAIGIRLKNLPMTPDKVLDALQHKA